MYVYSSSFLLRVCKRSSCHSESGEGQIPGDTLSCPFTVSPGLPRVPLTFISPWSSKTGFELFKFVYVNLFFKTTEIIILLKFYLDYYSVNYY